MYPRFTLTAIAVASLFSQPAFAAPTEDEALVIVTASRIATKDTEAAFASEVHTRAQIRNSSATTLFDYLAQNSSIQIAPSYGDRNSPRIDMRGYGIGDGYQNIVVVLDGVRMNNIDMVPALIGSIPVADIEQIEITKGSGSVMQGDGAMAGTIQITTRKKPQGGRVEVTAGNFGAFSATASAGMSAQNFSLSGSASSTNSDGYSEVDTTGHKDASRNDAWRASASVTPWQPLTLKLGAGSTDIDTRYANYLTQAQFDQNPAQNGGPNQYTQQLLDTKYWNGGADLWLTPNLKLAANHQSDERISKFAAWWGNYRADYEQAFDDVSLQLLRGATTVTLGVQSAKGERTQAASNTTSKDNLGWFAQGQQIYGDLTLSLGARSETVEYTYAPVTGTALIQKDSLTAWDIGANYRVNDTLSVFSNLNQAFQSPDIDRFFGYDGSFNVVFNAFIKPATSQTFNLGLNHVTGSNKLKVAAFWTELEDEIYYYDSGVPFSPANINTNIDQSHKYGVEIQDSWKITPALMASINYAYTQAIIDKEDQGGGAFNGKELPGVSPHVVSLGLGYQFNDRTAAGLTHSWRSETWAAGDFDNNNLQRQRAYSSTDVSVRHRLKEDMELLASVANVFEHANGTWVADDVVYPGNFARTWKVGFRAAF